MNKQEQIKDHLRSIRYFSSPGVVWDCCKIVSKVQQELDAIKELLEPEPESLAASVLRLTDTCNELDRENATLRNDLSYMTLNYNDANSACRKLEEEIVRKDDELDAAIRSNTWLRESIEVLKKRNDELEQNLATVESLLHVAEKYSSALKADLDNKSQLYLDEARHVRELETGNRRLKTALEHKNESLKFTHSRLVEVRRGYEEDLVDTLALAAHRKKLLAEAKERIEELQQDLTTLSRQNWSRGK